MRTIGSVLAAAASCAALVIAAPAAGQKMLGSYSSLSGIAAQQAAQAALAR